MSFLAKSFYRKSACAVSTLASVAMLSPVAVAQSLPVDPNARLSVGANVGYIADAYATDRSISVMPQVFFDNNRWYAEGAEAGVYAYKDSVHHARVGLTYDGRSFDASDANGALRGLDDRKASVLAHASYMHVTPVGGFRIKATTDISGRHDGLAVSATHVSRFEHNKATVYPSVGITWHNEDYNQYYYGVSAAESLRTGIQVYHAKSGWSPFLSAMVNYDINDRFTLFGYQRLEWLSGAQKDSPMTDKNMGSTTRIGINYKF